jgi:hypothetical protein
MYALLAHALISIIMSIGSVHLFNLTWEEYIRRRREQEWIERSFRFVYSPPAFLSLAWGSTLCGLLLIWITLLLHAALFARQLPLVECVTPTLSGI